MPSPPPPTAANDAVFIEQATIPANMYAGTRHNVWVKMRNTGTSTWTANRLYRLGALNQNGGDSSDWATSRIHLPANVEPGGVVTFNFSVIAPDAAGAHHFRWRMVQDGVEWFGQSTTGVSVNVTIPPWGTAPPPPSDIYIARLAAANRTGSGGDDLLSRNFNFNVPLVGLPGRAGLDLNLSLAYNSLVWTKVEPPMSVMAPPPPPEFYFDADQGNPGPGFRLGFPVIQVSTGKVNGEYRCTGLKDRNGNYQSVAYNDYGRMTKITDTLGRVINFNYDANYRLLSLTQPRGAATHTWATFGYGSIIIRTAFDTGYRPVAMNGGDAGGEGNERNIETGGPTDTTNSYVNIVGPQNGTAITVLTQVGLQDGSHYKFEYNSWGQVTTIKRFAADGYLLTSTTYNLVAAARAGRR